jgi:hypothetical protein
MRRVAVGLTTALLSGVAVPCYAADITTNWNVITVSGDIKPGDFQAFKAATYNKVTATIILKSRGGNLSEALHIGNLIRERHHATHVPEYCFSACSYIWLGGELRSKTTKALIGFHQTLDIATGKPSLAGFTYVEAYLMRLGFSAEFVAFANSASPENITYLSPSDIKRFNIEVQISDKPIVGYVIAQGKPPVVTAQPVPPVLTHITQGVAPPDKSFGGTRALPPSPSVTYQLKPMPRVPVSHPETISGLTPWPVKE